MARSLGLQVLLEIHEESELNCFCENIDVVGVNNRDLKTFKTSVKNSHKLLPLLPKEVAKISESGISDPKDAAGLLVAGFDGLLIGESFMKNSRPEIACLDFIAELEEFKNHPAYQLF